MGVGIASLVALATACRRPAQTWTAETEPASEGRHLVIDEHAVADPPPVAVAPASRADASPNVPPPMPGWASPARRVTFPETTSSITREEFLRAHGITSDPPDAVCFPNGSPVCSCDRSFAVTIATTTTDILVCGKASEPPRAAVLPGIGYRTVLYAVDNGGLKVLLDVPTRATFDPENGDGALVGNVALHVIPSADGVTLVDAYETDSGPWCPQAVAKAASQQGPEWATIRRNYAATCASAGRYILRDGRLVKTASAPASSSVRGPIPVPTTTR